MFNLPCVRALITRNNKFKIRTKTFDSGYSEPEIFFDIQPLLFELYHMPQYATLLEATSEKASN